MDEISDALRKWQAFLQVSREEPKGVVRSKRDLGGFFQDLTQRLQNAETADGGSATRADGGTCRREGAAARCLGAELVWRRRRRRIMEVKSSCPRARAAWWIPRCQKKLGASPEAQMAPAQALHPFLLSSPIFTTSSLLLIPCA